MGRGTQIAGGGLLAIVIGIAASLYDPTLGAAVFEAAAFAGIQVPDLATYLPDLADLFSRDPPIHQLAVLLFWAVATLSVLVTGQRAWTRFTG